MKSHCFPQIKGCLSNSDSNLSDQLLKLNRLLKNLVHGGRFSDALHLFHRIHSSHRLNPDQYTLSTALFACASLPDSISGAQLHANSIKSGLKSFPHVANTLLSLYAKSRDLAAVKKAFAGMNRPDCYSRTTLLSACVKLGELDDALQLFDEMPERNLELWNALITGCAEKAYDEMAIHLFQKMHLLNVKSDHYTFACVLSLCSSLSSSPQFEFGKQVHSLIVKTGFLLKTSVVNSLLTMYFNGGSLADGYLIFEEVGCRVGDAITYNSIIAGLASVERYEEALSMFKEMLTVGISPTELTFVSVMGTCFSSKLADQLYAQAVKTRFGRCTSVNNAAISMYSSCRNSNAARLVFERLGEKDIVSWNAIIASYAQENSSKDAIFAYRQMQRDGKKPDEYTIGSLLASMDSRRDVEMIQGVVIKNGLISKTEVANALLSAFSKNGLIEEASDVFLDMPTRNLISWNALISGFLSNGLPTRGLRLFSMLPEFGMRPNHYTLSLVLSICANTSDLRRGKQVHAYVVKSRHFVANTLLGNSLITLYSKCGALDMSLRVFDSMTEKDTVSWNSIISAYSQYGDGKKAIERFEAMQSVATVEPDGATFTAILSACSHSGLVEEGIRIFDIMVQDYRIEPEMHHVSCLFDLLGRAGLVDVAEGIIRVRSGEIDPRVWWALLSSCVAHGQVRLGSMVAEFLLETEKDDPAIYVLVSNLYAGAGKWEQSANLRRLVAGCGATKMPGSSWIAS
ncbi:pentatricopeptide repeat-containing protein At3g49740 [Andrographis paniculata]|uniref:pentatricopeptide repeat-containing protein At3g49740 n=1 Tax=Andrographis paniculata TaxID=175694 RepID=UPI0021E7F973|nr:pentatricopeptide repeat-containing protein At3g49740 [Andrographis paniculata]